jgi:hypothetical protein
MTLCCTANAPRSITSMSTEVVIGPAAPVSIAFGTTRQPTKPIAYRKAPKKNR